MISPLVGSVSEAEIERLRAAVADTLDLGVSEIQFDTELAATGRLDSLAIVNLVTFLGDEMGVRVAVDQLVPENFASLRRMSQLVERIRRQSP